MIATELNGCRQLTIEDIDVDSAIDSVKELLKKERDLSPALRSALEVMLLLVSLLLNRVTLNSKNSKNSVSANISAYLTLYSRRHFLNIPG